MVWFTCWICCKVSFKHDSTDIQVRVVAANAAGRGVPSEVFEIYNPKRAHPTDVEMFYARLRGGDERLRGKALVGLQAISATRQSPTYRWDRV